MKNVNEKREIQSNFNDEQINSSVQTPRTLRILFLRILLYTREVDTANESKTT